jgi:hypothetical protein
MGPPQVPGFSEIPVRVRSHGRAERVFHPLFPPLLSMAFTHNGYTLHAREIELKGGHKQVIYFFSQRSPKSGMPVELPQGYALAVNKRTGLPYLKKT